MRLTGLQREPILAVRLNDPALLAGFHNGHLRRAFGTFGELHDLATQVGVPYTCSPRLAIAWVTSVLSTLRRGAAGTALDGAVAENHNVCGFNSNRRGGCGAA
jgi:hypothetical protein